MSEHMSPIPSRLYNVAVGGHVAGADQIIDDETGLTLDKVAGGVLEEKEYMSGSNNGMGRTVLRKNLVNGVNTLTQTMINKSNTIYVIQYDFDLDGAEVAIPANCVLEFDGGSLSNGTITGQNTLINGTPKFGNELIFDGSFTGVVCVSWLNDINSLNSAIKCFDTINVNKDITIGTSIIENLDGKSKTIFSNSKNIVTLANNSRIYLYNGLGAFPSADNSDSVSGTLNISGITFISVSFNPNESQQLLLASFEEVIIEDCGFRVSPVEDTTPKGTCQLWCHAVNRIYIKNTTFKNLIPGTVGGNVWILNGNPNNNSYNIFNFKDCIFESIAGDEPIAIYNRSNSSYDYSFIMKDCELYVDASKMVKKTSFLINNYTQSNGKVIVQIENVKTKVTGGDASSGLICVSGATSRIKAEINNCYLESYNYNAAISCEAYAYDSSLLSLNNVTLINNHNGDSYFIDCPYCNVSIKNSCLTNAHNQGGIFKTKYSNNGIKGNILIDNSLITCGKLSNKYNSKSIIYSNSIFNVQQNPDTFTLISTDFIPFQADVIFDNIQINDFRYYGRLHSISKNKSLLYAGTLSGKQSVSPFIGDQSSDVDKVLISKYPLTKITANVNGAIKTLSNPTSTQLFSWYRYNLKSLMNYSNTNINGPIRIVIRTESASGNDILDCNYYLNIDNSINNNALLDFKTIGALNNADDIDYPSNNSVVCKKNGQFWHISSGNYYSFIGLIAPKLPNSQFYLTHYTKVSVINTLSLIVEGYYLYLTDKHRPVWYNGTNWINADGTAYNVMRKGTTVQRPTLTNNDIGFCYIDETLNNKPIFYAGNNTWVDATGATV